MKKQAIALRLQEKIGVHELIIKYKFMIVRLLTILELKFCVITFVNTD